MNASEFEDFTTHIADAAAAFNESRNLDAGPVISSRWEPDDQGFSVIEVGLRWTERTPLDELAGDAS